ncbi:MAG: DNA/RNA non-specific endonuclease [Treponema sp.]|nr:DNA/RNA non-specific endonuclease [Treponema sp.]
MKFFKKIFLPLILFNLAFTGLYADEHQLIQLPLNLEIPSCPKDENSREAHSDHYIRHFKGFTVCYRESYEQAEWCAYKLEDSNIRKNAKRSNDFRPDYQIPTGSAEPSDYRRSGYDRGHLAPAADFSFDKAYMNETFYLSNITPQDHGLNGGIWNDLESQVRRWAKRFGRVYVVTGPILEKRPNQYKSIGANKVAVPEFYYKVILAPRYKSREDRQTRDDTGRISAIGFIFPNENAEGSIYDYSCTVDEIEKRTKIDFFDALEDYWEEKVESTVNLEHWQ